MEECADVFFVFGGEFCFGIWTFVFFVRDFDTVEDGVHDGVVVFALQVCDKLVKLGVGGHFDVIVKMSGYKISEFVVWSA